MYGWMTWKGHGGRWVDVEGEVADDLARGRRVVFCRRFSYLPAPPMGKGGNGEGGSEHLQSLPHVQGMGANTTLPRTLNSCKFNF